MALRADELPERAANTGGFACSVCGDVPETLNLASVGPSVTALCELCGGRITPPNGLWLPKASIGLARRTVRSSEFDPSVRAAILERDGHRCQWCGRTPKSGVILHVDHIVPVSQGGESSEDNGLTLCEECNLGKGKSTSLLSQFHSWRSRVTRLAGAAQSLTDEGGGLDDTLGG